MNEFNWACPHCQRDQTVSSGKVDLSKIRLSVGETIFKHVCLEALTIGCSNPICKEFTTTVTLRAGQYSDYNVFKAEKVISIHRLRPEFSYRVQPDYIPNSIVQDFIEACRIRDLSPKASATLARRCVQGIIRDFCKVTGATLFKEIDALRKQVENGKAPSGVTVESVDAIDHVRTIGNIGAHMEKDIDLIIDVDPNEAQALIELIELLFEEWYVARNMRDQKLSRIKQIGSAKAELKKSTEL